MKQITFIFLLAFATTFLFAKEGENPVAGEKDQVCELKGQITDKINGEVLTGVAVKIAGSDQVAYTDFDGEFSFENLRPGTYTLKTDMVSYKEQQMIVQADATTEQDLEISLETITE